VAREVDPKDSRAAKVKLTAAGARAAARVEEQELAFAQSILDRLGSKRSHEVLDAVSELLTAVRDATEGCCPGAFEFLMEDLPVRARVRGGAVTANAALGSETKRGEEAVAQVRERYGRSPRKGRRLLRAHAGRHVLLWRRRRERVGEARLQGQGPLGRTRRRRSGPRLRAPVQHLQLQPGERVLDLGSGGGIDVFLAAKAVGPTGHVIGVDMTPAMLERARCNAEKGGYANVEFREGRLERLPVEDGTIDAVTSNCVINLVPDKAAVFAEIARVLKPGGEWSSRT